MLINFRLSNFLSYYTKQELSMQSGRSNTHKDHLYRIKDNSILKGSFIYGSNAAGKSNLIKGIDFAKNCILGNIDTLHTFEKNYKLKSHTNQEETKFEFDISIDDEIYSYSFSLFLETKKVIYEKLTKINSTDIVLYEHNRLSKNDIIINPELSTKDTRKLQLYAEDIEDHSLLLNIFGRIKLDESIFDKILKWFNDSLLVIFPDTHSLIPENISNKKDFLNIITHLNIGIYDIELEQTTFDKLSVRDSERNDLLNQIRKDLDISKNNKIWALIKNNFAEITMMNNTIIIHEILFVHSDVGNNKVTFKFNEESDGTKRLIELIPLLYKQNTNKTIIIDELERSLHPLLVDKFLQLFYFNTKNNKSQFIITTHESRLLDLQKIRRDEIWFTERDFQNGTKLYSLEEFKTTFDSTLDHAYLDGRFGGIPNITTLLEDE